MRINKSLITLASGGTASSVPWSGVTGTPTTLSGYGITDAVPSSRTLTINGTSYDLSADRTWTIATGSVTSVALATGTTGTDVNVSGSPITTSGTITLNIPDASTTARGLVTILSQTFLGTKTFSSGIITTSDAGGTRGVIVNGNTSANIAGYIAIKSGVSGWTAQATDYVGISSQQADYLTLFFQGQTKVANLIGSSLTTPRNYTLPDASGTIALTSSLSGYVPTTRTLTINDTAFDLSADRSWSVGDYGTW